MRNMMLATFATAGAVAVYALAPASSASQQQPSSTASAAQPVVLELFQSQGCSSCPPANAVLDQIANRPDVLALNFAVTYWDQLGWKDSFARPEFTARQWDYAHAQGRGNVATPQLIVNGRGAVLGSVRADVDRAIGAYARRGPQPEIAASSGELNGGAAPTTSPASVWLVDYDPRTIQVPVRAGENGGRTLPHRDIVKRMTALGTWRGAAAHYRIAAATPGLARAVLVQQGKGGPIIAAAKL